MSDILADETSNESSTEDKESDSSSVESGDEEEWSDNLEFVIIEDFNKPTRPTTVLLATATPETSVGQLGVVPCVTLPCVACFEPLHSEQHCLVRGQHGSTKFKFEGLIVVNILNFI